MIQFNSILKFIPSDDKTRAEVKISKGNPDFPPLTPFLTAKFCEHLRFNIYNGMHAEILQNPTFADHPFPSKGGGSPPDGGRKFLCDEKAIKEMILLLVKSGFFKCPDPVKLLEARSDVLAMSWVKEGPRKKVRTTSDAAPHKGRAQRVEVAKGGQGIAQWTYLPMHRTRNYQWRVVVRSSDLNKLCLTMTNRNNRVVARSEITGVGRKWKTFFGNLRVRAGTKPDDLYKFSLTALTPGQFVVSRVLLYPADHVHGADPDVVRFLKDSNLPLLRWPGGNFASGYRWRDGIGPVDERPTLPNPAWGGLEPGLFGTDEFIKFCRAVGCEPMICVNAGNGTAEEAARWVEYCNGSKNTPMGKLRSKYGHPEPFKIRYWEIGNELHSSHQIGWTTGAGYADRYHEFVEVMRKVDANIRFIAYGPPVLRGGVLGWYQSLIRNNPKNVRRVSDHILEGGDIATSTDPLIVYTDFMAFPAHYEKVYSKLFKTLVKNGVKDPRLAITELQLFGRLRSSSGEKKPRLTEKNFITPSSWAEAAFCTLIYHMSARLNPFVEMITHSATVNHGGGLRKYKERVYTNPCHHAQKAFSVFNGAMPLPVKLRCGSYETKGVLRRLPGKMRSTLVDVLAAKKDSSLIISIVNRATHMVETTLDLSAFKSTGKMEIIKLGANRPWAKNSLDEPQKIVPVTECTSFKNGKIVLRVKPYTLLQLRMSK